MACHNGGLLSFTIRKALAQKNSELLYVAQIQYRGFWTLVIRSRSLILKPALALIEDYESVLFESASLKLSELVLWK